MRRAWAVWVALAIVGKASAQVTTLVTIPIADTKGVYEAELGHYVSGYERSIDPRYYHYTYFNVGIHDRIELGASTDYLGTETWGFKVKLIDDKQGVYAVSGGYNNISRGDSTPFLVGRYNFKCFRFHAGWMRDDRDRLILGADTPLTDQLTAAADFTSSDGGVTWLALFYSLPFAQGLTLSANLGIPNNKDDGLQHSFGLIYNFRF